MGAETRLRTFLGTLHLPVPALFCRFPESGIHFGMVPGLPGGPERKSPGTAKSCWTGKKLVIEERRCQKVSKAASVQAEAAFFLFFFFFLLLSSWDYSLCAEPTRDRRACEREAQGGSGAAPFESFRSFLHLCIVAGVSLPAPASFMEAMQILHEAGPGEGSFQAAGAPVTAKVMEEVMNLSACQCSRP